MNENRIWWMNNDQLNACPFCGNQAYLKSRDYGTSGEKYYVFCSGCYVETFRYHTVHDAIESWNRRTCSCKHSEE